MPGPGVMGVSSGSFYNRFHDYESYNCKRGIWLKDGNAATLTGSNRNQFHNCRIGQFGPQAGGVGANTGIQIDSGGTNKFFGCSVEDLLAQQQYTDLVIDGTTNTKCTSAAHPFTTASIGFTLVVTSGTGWTVQIVTILSVTAGKATCSAALGTLGSTGGVGMTNNGPNAVATAIVVKFLNAIGQGNNDNDFYGYTAEACDRSLQCENLFTNFYGGGSPLAYSNLSVFSAFNATVVYGGSGYTSIPTVTVSGGGNQPGKVLPTVTALVASLPGSPGPVTGFNIAYSDQGSMLTEPPILTISGGGGSGARALCNLNFPRVALGDDASIFPISIPGMIFPAGNLGPANATLQNMWNILAGLYFPLQIADQFLLGGKLDTAHGTGLSQMATFKPPNDNWGYSAIFLTDAVGRGILIADQNFDVIAGTGNAIFLSPTSLTAAVTGATFAGPFEINSSTLKVDYLTPFSPVLTDGTSNLESGAIDLASPAFVTGLLATTNGGTGANYANFAALATAIISSGTGILATVNGGTGANYANFAALAAAVIASGGSVGGVLTGSLPNPGMAATGVTPGTYTSADITIGADGRVVNAANGGGTSGVSATIVTAKLTTLGANGSMTFVNGLLTAQTQAT